MKRRGILTAGGRGSAQTQPQRLEMLGVLRLVLPTQPRSADHASRITFRV